MKNLTRLGGLQKGRRDLVPDSLFLQPLQHNGQRALKCQGRMNLRRTPLMDPFGAFIWDSLVPEAALGYGSGCAVASPPVTVKPLIFSPGTSATDNMAAMEGGQQDPPRIPPRRGS